MTTLAQEYSEAELDCASRLYVEAFPPEERRPWADIADPGSDPQLYMIRSDGSFSGFITLWDFGSFVYIEHLATLPSLRGQGIGADAVRLAASLAECRPVVLECEHPTPSDPFTGRRLSFYRRLGFEVLNDKYVQPPYSAELPPVPLLLLSTAPISDPTTELHRRVYGCQKLAARPTENDRVE